jgi:hypothetical protein
MRRFSPGLRWIIFLRLRFDCNFDGDFDCESVSDNSVSFGWLSDLLSFKRHWSQQKQ